MHDVVEKVHKAADALREESVPSDQLGRLTDRSAATLRETGLVRLLQPKEFGGFEAHPNDFLEAVMAAGVASPSAGWVAGVVGVHPWEIATDGPAPPGGDLGRGPRHLDGLALRAVRPRPSRRRRLPVHRPVALLDRHRPRRVGHPRWLRARRAG